MNIEPLITRIKALNFVMAEFYYNEHIILSLFKQETEKLAPILLPKDVEVINNAVHERIGIIQRLHDVVKELNSDIETLEIEVKNE